ncbi:peroxiredoxin Q [Dendrothele bispora CBS 962.96]|uniref:thioredoxin-dependent peroxiredoxin n=1 Tax=Dendrothele bispora (strain CBS 962.96) TaxID=1314807 RepID=A0A4S8MQG0_DENBC|nr:peroxiredoxin Q [Dendrothele bispora CBS 962.96]
MSWQSLIGKPAPSLTLPNYDGESYTVSPGKDSIPLVLFFYPRSGSFGCTKEACQFRDALAEKETFRNDKVRVVGISQDAVEKQKLFVEQHKLPYPVLSDAKGEARKAYYVGRGLLGLVEGRITFIIDKKGVLRDAFESTMNYSAHVKFVTRWLSKLEAENDVPPPTATESAPPTVAVSAPEATAAA